MSPLDRQLDRLRDILVSAPAGASARPPASGSAHPAAPEPIPPVPGAATTGCVCGIATCDRAAVSRGWCKKHYDSWHRTGSPVGPTFIEKFWARIDRRPSGCWEWTGQRQATGHGRLYRDGRTDGAHRVSYELLVGPIPEGLVIDHLCQNPPCVNPAHLEPVTIAENTRRAMSVIHLTGACRNGHHMDEANTYVVPSTGQLRCRECYRQRARVGDARRRGRAEPYPARVTTGQATTKSTNTETTPALRETSRGS